MCRQNKLLSSLYTRWITTEFLEGGLLKLMSNILSVVHCEQSQYNQEYCKLKKKNFLTGVFQKILFIDTEKLSKMQISLQVFFKDFADRFRITYLKNGFFWSCFSKILSTDFKIRFQVLIFTFISLIFDTLRLDCVLLTILSY